MQKPRKVPSNAAECHFSCHKSVTGHFSSQYWPKPHFCPNPVFSHFSPFRPLPVPIFLSLICHARPDPHGGGCPARCPGGCPGPGPGPGTLGAIAIQRPRLERSPRRIGNMSAPAIQHGVECRARSRPRGARGGVLLAVRAGDGRGYNGYNLLEWQDKRLRHPTCSAIACSVLFGHSRKAISTAFRTSPRSSRLAGRVIFVLVQSSSCTVLAFKPSTCACPSPVLAASLSPRTRQHGRRHRPGHVRRRSAGHRGSGHPTSGRFRAPIQGGASAG